MPLLSDNNITAELSYAYLHAIAAKAGMECTSSGRHADGAGVDATIRVQENFGDGSLIYDFTIDVQLKSTIQQPVETENRYSYPLGIKNYNELRATTCNPLKLLVVLFLPTDHDQWLEVSTEQLIARRCAYWLGLHGAPASGNETNQTVYIPTANILSPESLRTIAETFSRQEQLNYAV